MDFTTTNIVMCKEAKGIQEQWQPQRGDFAFWEASIEEPEPVLIYDVDGELLKVITILHGTYHILTKDDLIWLPRQDQLQNMLDVDFYYHAFILNEPNTVMKQIYSDDGVWSPFESGEQFWLAFVMWVKEGKAWDAQERRWR